MKAMPATAITEASRCTRGRNKADLNGATALAGSEFVGVVEMEGVKVNKGRTTVEESTPRVYSKEHRSGDTIRDGKPGSSGGGTRSNRAASVGAKATGALLAASGDTKRTSRAIDIRGAPEADSDTKDATNNDGTSDVAAAFGRIRLSGSLPECRAAAKYVLDYCRRVRDSPSVPLHWKIPLASKRFASTVGRWGLL